MVSIQLLEKLPIFKEFNSSELEKILGICSTEHYELGDCLFKEGDAAKEMWIVIEGKVELRFELPDNRPSTSESMVSSHQKETPESQVFGWSCFIPPYKMRLSAYCNSRRCQVLKIDIGNLNQIMAEDKEIGFKIMYYLVQVIGFRFKQMQDHVAKIIGIGMINSW